MLSPRNAADGPRPTLSNFGCFIPRPAPAKSGEVSRSNPAKSSADSGLSGGISGLSDGIARLSGGIAGMLSPRGGIGGMLSPRGGPAGLLSPRFMGPDKQHGDKQSKPQNATRKALGARGGSGKERDGFEIFYGLEPKSTRPRRRSSTGASAPLAASTASKVASASTPAATDGPVQQRPCVPTLQLGSTSDGHPSSAQRRSTQQSTASASASTAAAEAADPIAAVSSPATAAVAAVTAFTWESPAVDVAPGEPTTQISGTLPTAEPTAPASSEAPVEDKKSRRRSTAGSPSPKEIWTPRGVPVFSLSGQSRRAAEEQQQLPRTMDSYSVASAEPSPSPPSETQSTSTGDLNGSRSAANLAESTSVTARAARPVIPVLSLPRQQS